MQKYNRSDFILIAMKNALIYIRKGKKFKDREDNKREYSTIA